VNMYGFYLWSCDFDCMTNAGVTMMKISSQDSWQPPASCSYRKAGQGCYCLSGWISCWCQGPICWCKFVCSADRFSFNSVSVSLFFSRCSYLIWKYICYRARMRRSLSTTTWHF
jgi:hypothetical protein